MGINHLTDMTYEQISKHYNLKVIEPKEFKQNLRVLGAVTLDDFNDDDETFSKTPAGVRLDVDHRASFRPVRDQGGCGSCWAFGTTAAIEGNYGIKYNVKQPIQDYLSVQQLIDCDTGDQGCNGGWFANAMNFFKTKYPIFESNYPYEQQNGTCREAGKSIFNGIRITSYTYTYNPDGQFNSLLLGPIAGAIDANDSFAAYTSGIFDAPCGPAVNHAIVIVGYNLADGAWIVRNSWGAGWGESGYMRVKENLANNNSCMVGRYGYRPLI